MATIEIVIDNLILGVLYVAGVYGLVVLFWGFIFPAMAVEDEGDD